MSEEKTEGNRSNFQPPRKSIASRRRALCKLMQGNMKSGVGRTFLHHIQRREPGDPLSADRRQGSPSSIHPKFPKIGRHLRQLHPRVSYSSFEYQHATMAPARCAARTARLVCHRQLQPASIRALSTTSAARSPTAQTDAAPSPPKKLKPLTKEQKEFLASAVRNRFFIPH